MIVASLVVAWLCWRSPEKDRTEPVQRIRSWWIIVTLFALAMVMSRQVAVTFFAVVSFLAPKNTCPSCRPGAPPKPGTFSLNKGYFFVTEGGRPSGAVTIHAEKNYLMRIELTELFGLAEVKWVNEKLLFMRPWWGRIAATDLIYDVEAEKIIYAESVTDAYLAYQQFRDSCPVQGCECIKKRLE